MKKSKLIICLIISLILLIGCNNRSSVNKSGETDENDDGVIIDRISYRDARETYEYAKNVYEAELIDCKQLKNEEGDLYHLITVKINLVYKGEFLTGEVVQDQLYSTYYNGKPWLSTGSRYLFMTGVDDDFSGKGNYYESSLYYAVEIGDTGGYKNAGDGRDEFSVSKHKYYSYADIVYDMLNLELLEEVYGCYFVEDSRKGFLDNGLSLEAIYVLSDNVYIGEIIEFEGLSDANMTVEGFSEWWKRCPITKIKVKVLSVVKGDYTPGQIVEDIIPISLRSCDEYIDLDGLLCFSGDGFFEGYESMLNESAE